MGLNAVYAKAEIERRAGILSDAVKNVAPLVPSLSESMGEFHQVQLLLLAKLQGVNKDTTLTHLQDKTAWGLVGMQV